MAESTESGALFDMAGLGFSSAKKKLVKPVVPTVSVKVNGVAVELPEIPVRSTNENGIVDVTPYEVTYKLPEIGRASWRVRV